MSEKLTHDSSWMYCAQTCRCRWLRKYLLRFICWSKIERWRHFSSNPYFVAVLIGIQGTETGIMLLRFQQISQLASLKTRNVRFFPLVWQHWCDKVVRAAVFCPLVLHSYAAGLPFCSYRLFLAQARRALRLKLIVSNKGNFDFAARNYFTTTFLNWACWLIVPNLLDVNPLGFFPSQKASRGRSNIYGPR